MRIKEIMTRNVGGVALEASLTQVAEKMRALDVGILPVADGQSVKGVVTDRDITVRAVALGKNPDSMQVKEIMTKDVEWCYEDEDIHEVARDLEEKQIRRILVKDRDEKMVGIVSLGDIAVKGEEDVAAEVLHEVSEPAHPSR